MKKVIYHYGSLAGWPFALAQGFRDQGYNSINVVHDVADKSGTTNSQGNKSNRKLKYDECLNYESYSAVRKLFNRVRLVCRMLCNAQVVHYHGSTILPYNVDVLIFKWFGIPTVISWGGSEARIIEVAAAKNPYFFRYQEPFKDLAVRKMLKRLSKFGVTVATDPEMGLYMEGFFDTVHTFRAPININELYCKYPDVQNKKPIFLHIPTHPFVKGSIHITNAFKKLTKEGFQFEPILLESTLTQEDMRKKISECDVYVDELRCGSYGYTALEAAGSGKPTLTHIIDEVVAKLPSDLPFVNTSADNLYENLKWLIESPDKRHEIGLKSRAYVENHHHVVAVVKDMVALYRRLGAKDL